MREQTTLASLDNQLQKLKKDTRALTGESIDSIVLAAEAAILPIDLTTEVTGDLPLANLAPASAASRFLVRDSAGGPGDWQEGTFGTGLTLSGTTLQASGSVTTTAAGITIDGGGDVIATGIKGDIVIPVACTIVKATLLADQTGSIVVDVWKDSYANFPPTGADSITASAKPTISSGVKSQDSTLTGWSTSLSAGDVLRFNVDSCSAITRCILVLEVTI